MFNKFNIWKKTTFKILNTLTKTPNEKYHVRNIARKSDISPASASNILKDLKENYMVNKETIGRQIFYSANMENPIVIQFKVFNNILDIYNVFNEIKDFSKQIILFGSASEGKNTKKSDIDLFIKTKTPKKVKSKIEHESKISPIIIKPENFVEFKKENEALYENIKKGIELWRKEDEL